MSVFLSNFFACMHLLYIITSSPPTIFCTLVLDLDVITTQLEMEGGIYRAVPPTASPTYTTPLTQQQLVASICRVFRSGWQ